MRIRWIRIRIRNTACLAGFLPKRSQINMYKLAPYYYEQTIISKPRQTQKSKYMYCGGDGGCNKSGK